MRVQIALAERANVVELPANATYGDLKAAVFDKTGIAPGAVELKTGFPPAKIDGEDAAVAAVSNGESITVAEIASAIPAVAPAHAVSHPPSMDEDEALARAIAASLADAAPRSGPP